MRMNMRKNQVGSFLFYSICPITTMTNGCFYACHFLKCRNSVDIPLCMARSGCSATMCGDAVALLPSARVQWALCLLVSLLVLRFDT
jgi:hypothetical protein